MGSETLVKETRGHQGCYTVCIARDQCDIKRVVHMDAVASDPRRMYRDRYLCHSQGEERRDPNAEHPMGPHDADDGVSRTKCSRLVNPYVY